LALPGKRRDVSRGFGVAPPMSVRRKVMLSCAGDVARLELF
jgi:hypothetical protein